MSSVLTRLWRASCPFVKRFLIVAGVVVAAGYAAFYSLVLYHWGVPCQPPSLLYDEATICLVPSPERQRIYRLEPLASLSRPTDPLPEQPVPLVMGTGPLGSIVYGCNCEAARPAPIGASSVRAIEPAYVKLALRTLLQQPSFLLTLFTFGFLAASAAFRARAWPTAVEAFSHYLQEYDEERGKPHPSAGVLCWHAINMLVAPAVGFVGAVLLSLGDFLTLRSRA